MPEYFTLDNGRHPYNVVLTRKSLLVYAEAKKQSQVHFAPQEEDHVHFAPQEEDQDSNNGYMTDDSHTDYGQLVAAFPAYHKVLVPGLSFGCKGTKGTTFLVKPLKGKNEWVYINGRIESFEMEENDEMDFFEAIELSNQVMYPVVFGSQFCYFLLDGMTLPRSKVEEYLRNHPAENRNVWSRNLPDTSYRVFYENKDETLKRPIRNLKTLHWVP